MNAKDARVEPGQPGKEAVQTREDSRVSTHTDSCANSASFGVSQGLLTGSKSELGKYCHFLLAPGRRCLQAR